MPVASAAPSRAAPPRSSATSSPSRYSACRGAEFVTDTLLLERPHAGVLLVTLNRPKQLNAINDAMRRELIETLASVGADVNAIVLTGAGRGFCSGIDMRDFGPAVPAADAPA